MMFHVVSLTVALHTWWENAIPVRRHFDIEADPQCWFTSAIPSLDNHWHSSLCIFLCFLCACACVNRALYSLFPLRWRHNGHHCVSNHRSLGCLFYTLFKPTSKKTSRPALLVLCEENSPLTGEFSSQRTSNAENVSIWWRHNDNHYICVWLPWNHVEMGCRGDEFSFYHFYMTTENAVHLYWVCYPVLVTVYPKKYAHGFCFAVLCCGYALTDFPISIRLTSLALWQSNDCPSASKATLMNMDTYFMWIHYERLHNHNKAKHNKTVCIFLGMYCICIADLGALPVTYSHLVHGDLGHHCLKKRQIITIAWVNVTSALRWRHNERDSVSNHQPRDCLLNRLFRRRSK